MTILLGVGWYRATIVLLCLYILKKYILEIWLSATDASHTHRQTTKYSATQLVFSLKFKLTQSSRYVRVCVASLPDTPYSPQQSINIEGNEGCYTSYCGMNINIYLMVIHIAAKQIFYALAQCRRVDFYKHFLLSARKRLYALCSPHKS